ncbi:hypothetical protein G7Y89_g12804 [Cudoniella acicularis]|uniref:Uncharacterized protein n=1 Tax=Cudoniella acicularis TaxID=354080 RepID=A0A8H4RAQ9_9HELO|nr:hypothetical protein G7Y89_g12804 [Cudoniella acicularis]
MASSTSTRRVLGDLDVNTTTAGSPAKSRKVGEGASPYLQISFEKRKYSSEEARMGSGKRGRNLAEADQGSPKRVKRDISIEHSTRRGDGLSKSAQSNAGRSNVNSPLREEDASDFGVNHDYPSSPSMSPASSFTSSQAALNDSQHTVLTEPDDVALPAPAIPLSVPIALTKKEEARKKAAKLRLRLRLANYKVRTNQINIPMDQLQIRSCSSSPLSRPTRRVPFSTPETPECQTPLPIAPQTKIPSISLQKPSAEKNRAPITTIPSSPPSAYSEKGSSAPPSPCSLSREDEEPRDGFATPLLPRQREGLLNPPNLGSASLSSDLTSSVVKGRAADGLLSLMRHQN